MAAHRKVIKVLDAASGLGEEFISVDNILNYRLSISGTAGANIKAFYIEQIKNNAFFYLKIYCANWAGAIVNLQSKSTNVDDEWSNTGDVIKKDSVKTFIYDRL